MFSGAIALASQYTRPVILSKRLGNKQLSSGVATFMIVNDSGWILTAAHVLQDVMLAEQHAKERAKYEQKVDAINSDSSLSPGKKKFQLNQLRENREWITHNSVWWGNDSVGFDIIHLELHTDLAIAKLNGPFASLGSKVFPKFGDPSVDLAPGTSLCRLRFPFHEVKISFDENENRFNIQNLPRTMTMFPNDGIHTRHVISKDQTSNQEVHFIETSTPGLRGQSGGPIFDVHGKVWALQSRTTSLSLGFSPTVTVNGREVTEHQFMHVGWGTHVSHIIELLKKYNVPFDSQ